MADSGSHKISSSMAANRPRVAIVGAGISGLRCADVLLTAGADVKVFEARDRIGGRVHQVSVGGHLADLGANWIHDPDGNPIIEIAKRTHTELFRRPEELAVVGSDGKHRSNEVAMRLASALEAIIEDAYKYSTEHTETIDPNTSLWDFVQTKAEEAYSGDPQFLADLLNEAQRFGLYIGDPISKQSLKYLTIEEGAGGDDPFVAGTYKDILAYIAKKALGAKVVYLGNEVTKIVYEAAGQVSVRTAEGASEVFDDVVVTCPLGWLKQNKESVFSPSLPQQLSTAIENVGYGKLEKLYISFPRAFWLGSQQEHDTASLTADCPFPTSFHDPEYGFYPPGLPSNLVILSLAHLPPSVRHPTLLLYIHGPCGTKMAQSIIGLEQNSTDYNKTIDRFARPYYSKLPNYNQKDPDCSPTALLASAWQADRLAGNGSYSNGQAGSTQLDVDLEVLRESGGLGENRGLWFAGEHTAPVQNLATTTGAYISGQRVAEEILKERSGR